MDELIKKRIYHGGDVYSPGRENMLDLSSNINPMPLPEEVYVALPSILEKARKYPDVEYRELKSTVATYLSGYLGKKESIIPEDITLGQGAVEILDRTISLFSHIIIVRPCFSEYEASARRYSKEITYIDRDMGWEYGIIGFSTIRRILDKVTSDSLVVICNPNNPDGAIYDVECIEYLLKELRKRDSYLMADETFAEYIGRNDLNILSLLKDRKEEFKNLIVVKALTKFFGLPGVRLGYGISGSRTLNDSIISRQTTWNIGAFAEGLAGILLKDKEFIGKSIEQNNLDRRYLRENLARTGLFSNIHHSFSDFLTVSLKNAYDKRQFTEHLERDGILIRNLFNMPPFTDRDFRIAVKGKDATDRLLASLDTFRSRDR